MKIGFKVCKAKVDKWLEFYGLYELNSVIYGLIEQESSWNPMSYKTEKHLSFKDPAHASDIVASYGLMQILNKTAYEDLGYVGPWDGLFDVDTNLKYGLLFFKRQLIRYDWQIEAAIEAYNAGHQDATQTTEYAQKVMARAKTYTV